jgi:homoaconitase/3-isopropylmalate dehydratase large subunit
MIAELGATAAVFPPDDRTRDWLDRQDRPDDFVEVGADVGAEYDDRIEVDLDALGPLVAKPHNPDNVVPVEEVAGTEISQVCIGSSVNSGYNDLAFAGAILADRDGQIVHPSITATATPGSRQILGAIAESGVYRLLSDGGVRMLEPVCGPCVGVGQAPPPPRSRVPQAPQGMGKRVHRRRRQLRAGLLARARRACAFAPRGQSGHRQVVRAHPSPKPDRAGDRGFDVFG